MFSRRPSTNLTKRPRRSTYGAKQLPVTGVVRLSNSTDQTLYLVRGYKDIPRKVRPHTSVTWEFDALATGSNTEAEFITDRGQKVSLLWDGSEGAREKRMGERWTAETKGDCVAEMKGENLDVRIVIRDDIKDFASRASSFSHASIWEAPQHSNWPAPQQVRVFV